jgi:uncharacterized protein involved in exopolysaccharide biosynthesis
MMMEEKQKIINIEIREVIRLLMNDRKKICLYSCLAGIIGVVLAFATPKIYKSTVMLAPEESGNGFSGSLSSLASLVGSNMRIGHSGDALYPEIYPDLMTSTQFLVGLFSIPVTTSDAKEHYTYRDYLENHQKEALYDYPMIGLKLLVEKLQNKDNNSPHHQPDPFRLTKKEEGIAKSIAKRINCLVDKKTSVITITVTDQDPLIAATMADSIQEHLQEAITVYRTQKAKNDLKYLNQLYTEAQQQYQKARHAYAAYCDAHVNVTLQSVQSKIDDLESDLQLKHNIYNQVVEQLQLAKAKVIERTPAFTIVQNATVPNKHSNMPKIVTLIIWMLIGFLFRFGMIVWNNRKSFVNI